MAKERFVGMRLRIWDWILAPSGVLLMSVSIESSLPSAGRSFFSHVVSIAALS